MRLLLEGKRIFVTGGTRGVGAAICDVLAREGADVAFNYHENDADAAAMIEKIKAHGRRALSFKVSITDRMGFKRLTREVVSVWGGIDALVNNAGINRCDAFATTTDLAWDEVIDTNLNSLFAVTKPFFRQMLRQQRGHILNITSTSAIRSLPTSVHYATAKAGMIGFTKGLAREGARFGIIVNAIAIGIIETNVARGLPEKVRHMHDIWSAIGRRGRPEEIAEYVAFLVSDRNTFMVGDVLIIDGGSIT